MRFEIGQSVKVVEHSEGVYIGEVGTVIDAEKKANVELYIAEFPGHRSAHFTKSMLKETDEKKAICFDCKNCDLVGGDFPGYYSCKADEDYSDGAQTLHKYAEMVSECNDFVE